MKEIILYQFEKEINAPIELVFDCVSRDEHVLNWYSLLVENIYEDGTEQLNAGTKYISKMKMDKKVIEVECEIIEATIPFSSTVRANMKEGITTSSYTFSETENGTKMMVEVRMQPRNLFYKLFAQSTKYLYKLLYNEEFEKCISYIDEQQYGLSGKTFECSMEGSQILVYNSSDNEGNDWTDEDVVRGFSWREGSVAFGALLDPIESTFSVNVSDTFIEQASDAVRIIRVPFSTDGSGVEIGDVYDTIEIDLPKGEYSIYFEAFYGEDKEQERYNFTFVEESFVEPVIVRADEGIEIPTSFSS